MAKRLMIKPSGAKVLVPDESVQAAYEQGYRAENEAETRARAEHEIGAEQTGEAAVLGGLRGATLGLSDLALVGSGTYAPGELRAIQEANPVATPIGEVGGIAAGMALPEISGPGAAIGAGRLIGGGLRGAMLEGGIFGLGTAISDATLSDDPELTGEKLFTGAAAGALGGGAVHIGGKALATGVSALAGKLSGPGLRAALENFAEKAAVRQYALSSDMKKNGLFSRENTIGRYMLDNLLPKAKSLTAEGVNEQAVLASAAHGQELETVLRDVDSKALGFDSSRLRVRAQAEILDKIQDDPALKNVTNKINDLLDGYDAKSMNFETAWARQSTLRTELGPLADESEKAVAKYQTQLRRLFRDEIIDQAGEVSPQYRTELKDISRNYGSAQQVEKLTKQTEMRQEGNRYHSLTDQILGSTLGAVGMMKAGPLGAMAGLAGAHLNKLARERGGSIIALGLDKLAKSGALEAVANGLKRTIEAGLESSSKFGGVFRLALEDAAAHGALSLLATHVRLAKGNPDYLAAVNMGDESPEVAAGYADKLNGLVALGAAAGAHDAKLEAGIASFLEQQPGPAPIGAVMTPARFAQISSVLKQAASNPQALAEMVQPGTSGGLAPATSTALSQTATRAFAFLAGVMPKPPRVDLMPALSETWTPGRLELERFGRYVNAIENPGGVLSDMRHGASPEGIAALRAVYPKLVADLQHRMMSRLAAWDKPLAHPKKLAMAGLFGGPVGNAGDPGLLNLLQQMHAVTMQPGKPQSGPGNGRQAVDVVKNFETQAQRIEAR